MLIPAPSIRSSVSLTPALSPRVNTIFWRTSSESIRSLVVPAIEDTIDLSLLNKALNKEDFPELGGPAIKTRGLLRLSFVEEQAPAKLENSTERRDTSLPSSSRF